jgi:hypothetical protein
MTTQASLSDDIRTEADRLLGSGLLTLLADYGEVHIVGSYKLGLMTWRDLDIHLVREPPDLNAFFSLGAAIAALLNPHRMQFRDELRVGTPGLPRGLYWGIYLGDERAGAWKIDVWQTARQGFDSVRRFGEKIASRLSDENRAVILAIKTACWHHPEYRRGFTSADVYAAVIDGGVCDVDGFWRELERTKGISAGRA